MPVLMLTARDAEIDRVLGLEVGADDYVTKPFSMRELIMRVRAMLRRRAIIQQTLVADQSASSAVIVAGGLRIEPEAHAISLDGQPVEPHAHRVRPAPLARQQRRTRVQPGVSARYGLGRKLRRWRPLGGQCRAAPA